MDEEEVPPGSEPSGEQIAAAAVAGHTLVVRTPVLRAEALDEMAGGPVYLKVESLQRTGSFKLRGATAKLAALGPAASAGVVAGSAGNHALALACASRAAGVPCEVFMPRDAAISKVDAARTFGATVNLESPTLTDAVAAARATARDRGLAFVHPFDDLDVIAGQATLGAEILDVVPDVTCVVTPLGGGGLVSGVAVAVKRARPEVRIVGVQAAAVAPFAASLAAGRPVDAVMTATIADGIAVKRPGHLTLALVERFVDAVETVTEDQIADAMVMLLEQAKLVVEGAGAVGVAAVLAGKVEARGAAGGARTVVVLSGGNVDAAVLAAVVRHHETLVGRSLVLVGRIGDRPGELARLLTALAEFGVNVVDVSHVREGVDLGVRESVVQIVVEARDRGDADKLRHWASVSGHALTVMDHDRTWPA